MVPEPEVKIALRSVVPVSSWRVGVPPVVSTTTGFEKPMVRLMTAPMV